MLERSESPASAAPKCVICGATSNGETWGHAMCPTHNGAWGNEKQFEAGEIDKAGPDSCTEYQRRTDAWVAEQKTKHRSLKVVRP